MIKIKGDYMKNFMQFMLPILIILIIGGIMMYLATPRGETRRLYISCNDVISRRNRFNVAATDIINFMENDDACELVVEVGNIGERYIRLITPYLFHLGITGERENIPRNEVFISIDEDVVLYSLDGETKFTFRFR